MSDRWQAAAVGWNSQISIWFDFKGGEEQICDVCAVFINFALFPHFVSNFICPHSPATIYPLKFTFSNANTLKQWKYQTRLYMVNILKACNHSCMHQSHNNSSYKIHLQKSFLYFDKLHILKACHIRWHMNISIKQINFFLILFWISILLFWKIWAGCSRLSANIGRFSNLAFLTQILHFVFVSAIFAVCLLANLNIIPQSGGRGGKIAVGDSKQQLNNTN